MAGPNKRRFEEIYRTGKRATGEHCRVFALPGTDFVGFATPKAVGCHARRNRMKRRLVEAARRERFFKGSGLDFVIAGNSSALDANLDKIHNDMATLVRDLKERWDGDSA